MRVTLSTLVPRARRIIPNKTRFHSQGQTTGILKMTHRSKDIDPLAGNSLEDVPQVSTTVIKIDPLKNLDDQKSLFEVPVKLIQQGEVSLLELCSVFPIFPLYSGSRF